MSSPLVSLCSLKKDELETKPWGRMSFHSQVILHCEFHVALQSNEPYLYILSISPQLRKYNRQCNNKKCFEREMCSLKEMPDKVVMQYKRKASKGAIEWMGDTSSVNSVTCNVYQRAVRFARQNTWYMSLFLNPNGWMARKSQPKRKAFNASLSSCFKEFNIPGRSCR